MVSTSSTDADVQSLQDQLNGQSRQYGITNGTLPQGAPAGSIATYQTATTVNIHFADSKGQFGNPIAIPKSLQYFTGVTSSAAAPTTTEIPTSGGFGWHLNTSTGAYYFALNSAGAIVYPNLAGISGTLTVTQHGNLAGTVTTLHDFDQISGTLTAAQHGNLATGTLHPFAVISGSITAAQHGAQTDSTLHAAATGSTAGFLSASDKTLINTATSSGTANALCKRDATGAAAFDFVNVSTNGYRVSGTKVVGAQQGAVADATGASLANAVATINSLLAKLRTHGLIDT